MCSEKEDRDENECLGPQEQEKDCNMGDRVRRGAVPWSYVYIASMGGYARKVKAEMSEEAEPLINSDVTLPTSPLEKQRKP